MPRTRRLDLAGVAQHVIQRGNDRGPCFFRRADYLRYLQCLERASTQHGCSIHAYVLMTNHVHLLATPDAPGGVSRMMQAVGRSYVRAVNDSIGRTGTLWEGRFKSCLVDSEQYLLTCYRYIELNPVRAGMVRAPEEYDWSSYGGNALGVGNPLLTEHECFRRLSPSASLRRERYRELVEDGVTDEQLSAIRLLTQRQRAFGSDAFRKRIEEATGQRVGIGKPG